MARRGSGVVDAATFLARVDQSGDCWLWLGRLDRRGYGAVEFGERASHHSRTQRAHRVGYELLVGPIPDGLVLDHLCCVPRCVNPLHLEPVTQAENMRRAVERRTHCRRGHLLDAANTGKNWGNNGRRCLRCARESNRRGVERKRASA